MSAPKVIVFVTKDGQKHNLKLKTNYSYVRLLEMCSSDTNKSLIESSEFIDWLITNNYYEQEKVSHK